MKQRIVLSFLFSILVLAVAAVGCGKGKDSPGNAGATASDNPASAEAAAKLDQAKASIKSKDYDKAVQLILDVQRQGAQLSESQRAQASKMMTDLQSIIVEAAAKGDAKAKAAGDILRNNASGR